VVQKKVVLLGASSVGKTSLVRQFVESLFDERYLTTIGVKVDKKRVDLNGDEVTLMLWDIAGAEEQFSFPSTYVRGAAGYLLVVDGTRPETLDTASAIVDQVTRDVGPLPCVIAANKADLADDWRIEPAALDALREKSGAIVLKTSAKTGAGVEEAFRSLTTAMLAKS
jgi:small GTP-binding protein